MRAQHLEKIPLCAIITCRTQLFIMVYDIIKKRKKKKRSLCIHLFEWFKIFLHTNHINFKNFQNYRIVTFFVFHTAQFYVTFNIQYKLNYERK